MCDISNERTKLGHFHHKYLCYLISDIDTQNSTLTLKRHALDFNKLLFSHLSMTMTSKSQIHGENLKK